MGKICELDDDKNPINAGNCKGWMDKIYTVVNKSLVLGKELGLYNLEIQF